MLKHQQVFEATVQSVRYQHTKHGIPRRANLMYPGRLARQVCVFMPAACKMYSVGMRHTIGDMTCSEIERHAGASNLHLSLPLPLYCSSLPSNPLQTRDAPHQSTHTFQQSCGCTYLSERCNNSICIAIDHTRYCILAMICR